MLTAYIYDRLGVINLPCKHGQVCVHKSEVTEVLDDPALGINKDVADVALRLACGADPEELTAQGSDTWAAVSMRHAYDSSKCVRVLRVGTKDSILKDIEERRETAILFPVKVGL